jgi:hypothetical protein
MLLRFGLIAATVLVSATLARAQVVTGEERVERFTDIRQIAAASSDYDYTEHLPSVNVRASSVAARAPGTWITAARARYTGAVDDGVGAADADSAESGSSTGSGSDLSGLLGGNAGGLGSLLSLLGGSTNLSSLAGLTGLTGGSSAVAGTQSTSTGALAGGSTTGTGTPRYTIDDLLAMRGGSGSDSAAKVNSTAQTKVDDRSQTTDDRPFRVRLLDSVLNTVFLGISAAFQSQDFIDIIKDQLRPIFFPQDASATDDSGSGDNTDDGSTDGGGDGGGDDSGGI